MNAGPTTASKALPVAAALSLACASFESTARALADEAPNSSPPTKTEERRFDRVDLERIEGFARFLTKHEPLLPPPPARPVIFQTLSRDGVLSNLNLHPLEQKALELLAITDADTLRFQIVATRPRVRDTFRSTDMFGPLEKTATPQLPSPPADLSKEQRWAYARALNFCHLIAGHLAITTANGDTSAEEAYLNSKPIERHLYLLQTIGALEVTDKVIQGSLASQIGHALLAKATNTITDEDRLHLPQLNELSRYTGNLWAYRAFVLTTGAATFGLYHLVRRRISTPEKIQS